MQFYLPLLLLVQSYKTLNLQLITFAYFPQPQPVPLIFKTDYRQSIFHSAVFQKNKLCTFSQLLNFFNLSPHPPKRPLYKVSPSFTYSFIFLSEIFFLFLGSAYPSSAITCEEIRVRVRLNPRPTKQTIKRAKKHAEFFNDTEVFVLLFSDSPV